MGAQEAVEDHSRENRQEQKTYLKLRLQQLPQLLAGEDQWPLSVHQAWHRLVSGKPALSDSDG